MLVPSFSKTKLTSDKNLLQPEPTPNRTPPRATNRSHLVALTQPRLSDFTEDPFRDYRYEDPFNITDPFADDETEDANANKSSGGEDRRAADPFGFGTSSAFSDKNASAKAFESDFSNTFPLAKTKIEKSSITANNNKFDADFGKAFAADNRNAPVIETDFSNAFANAKTKTVDLDEAFSAKGAKTFTKHETDATKTKTACNDEKLANDFGKMWNGNNMTDLSEAEQLAWAEKQSLKTERERLRRKEKEDADLALAIELSRQGKTGNV